MTMYETLTKPMRNALDAIRAGNRTFAKMNTLEALQTRKLIERINGVLQLSPVGETVYFEHEVMKKQHGLIFQSGDHVQYLHWKHNTQEWAFEWVEATVTRVTYAFVFLKYADGTEGRRAASSIRRPPDPVTAPIPGVPENTDEPHDDIGTLIGEPPLTLPDAVVVGNERDFYAEMSGVMQESAHEAEDAAADLAAYEALNAEVSTPLKITPREYAQYAATHLLTLSGIEVKQIAPPDGFDDGVRAIILEGVDQPVFVGTDERVLLATLKPADHFVDRDGKSLSVNDWVETLEVHPGAHLEAGVHGGIVGVKEGGKVIIGFPSIKTVTGAPILPLTYLSTDVRKIDPPEPIPDPVNTVDAYSGLADELLNKMAFDPDAFYAEQQREADSPYARFVIGDRAVRKSDNAEIVVESVDGDYIGGSGTRYCEKATGIIRSGNGEYIKARDYVHVPVTVKRAHRKHFLRSTNTAPLPEPNFPAAVDAAWKALGISSAQYIAEPPVFDLHDVQLHPNDWVETTEAHQGMDIPLYARGQITAFDAAGVRVKFVRFGGSLAFAYYPAESLVKLPPGCDYDFIDTSFEPLNLTPYRVDRQNVAVPAICSLCGAQYDSVHHYGLRNPWLFANAMSRCPVCDAIRFEQATQMRKHELDAIIVDGDFHLMSIPMDTSFEPYIPEPRMVNDQLIAVTGICDVCGSQYDEICHVSSTNPWRRAQIMERCHVCMQFSCFWYGEPLPAPANDVYFCAKCVPPQLGYAEVPQASPNIPAALCAEYPLLATFLHGGENAIHQLWAWYAVCISVALMDYYRLAGGDPLWQLSMRSAAALLHHRFEEEYLSLVGQVGHDAEAAALYHLLPVSAEADVRAWMLEYGAFEYPAQLIDARTPAYAVYVDPIPPMITPEEYRTERYGDKRRAGVCRVWWQGGIVEHVTQDDVTGAWYAHLYDRGLPVTLPDNALLDVEELAPARINDRVQRIDGERQFGDVFEVAGGVLYVRLEGGRTEPWTRVLVDVVATPDEIARNCAAIRLRFSGLRVGRIQSVKHLRGSIYRVFFEHRVPNGFVLARIKFVYTVEMVLHDTLDINLTFSPFWRRAQDVRVRQFQSILDTAGIALEARFNAKCELLVYHPLEDVLARLLPNVRKLAGVLAVSLCDDPCTALVVR